MGEIQLKLLGLGFGPRKSSSKAVPLDLYAMFPFTS